MYNFTSFSGEFIILLLLLTVCIRIFFTKNAHIDSIVLNAVLAPLFAVLQICAWGARFSEIFVLALALLVMILNYRALNRFGGKLFVDSYSIAFIVSSIIMTVILIASFILLFTTRPVRFNSSKYNVKCTTEKLAGNFEKGFGSMEKMKMPLESKLYHFESVKENSDKNNIVIIFVPDNRGETLSYEPYLLFLAREGYDVFSADFFTHSMPQMSISKDIPILRRGLMLIDSLSNKNSVENRKAFYKEYYETSYEALIDLAKEKMGNGKKYFLIGDGMSSYAMQSVKNDDVEIIGKLSLEQIKEYKTSGYGFIAQTDPFLSTFWFNQKRDSSGIVPKYAALQTAKKIAALHLQ